MKKIISDPYGYFIPEGTGRVIIDGDGLVENLPDDFELDEDGFGASLTTTEYSNPLFK